MMLKRCFTYLYNNIDFNIYKFLNHINYVFRSFICTYILYYIYRIPFLIGLKMFQIKQKENLPDAYIIIYSVTNRRSYVQARQILSKIETTLGTKAAILVGNKTDLARLRTVTTVGECKI